MALPEVNRARIEKLNIDVTGVKHDIESILGDIENIDPIILDENFPNIVPPAPSNVIASALFRNIQVSWAYNNASYIAEYEAHASQSPNFHTSNDTVVWRGMSGGFNHKASVGETWYFKIRIKNRHGEYSAFSEEVSAITVDISDFEIDEQYKIDLIEYTNQYTDERKDEIMGVVAGKLDAQVYHDNIILKADSQTVEEQFDTIYDELLKKVDTSRVETIEGDLAEKADAVWVGNQLVSKADADTVYSKTEVDNALNSRVSTTKYETDQAGVVTRFESAESRVTQTENELSSKVDSTTYEALEGRVSTTETGVTQNATSIASKASQTDLDIVTGEVATLDSTVTQQAGLIESKVDSTTYTQDKDGIISDINSHNTRITQNANDIELKASASELASATGRLTTAEGKITANATAISQRVTQSTYDKDINDGANGLFARMENAEAGIDTVAGSLHLYATESSVDTRMGDVVHRFEANEADIAINSTAISNRVTHTEYNALTKRVSTAEGSVTTLAGQVALKASTSDLNGVKGRLSTAESTLSVLPASIESKVSKDGVISAITQSPESLKINVAQVAIDGDLVVQNGLVRLKDAIIDKVHIKDSAIVGRMLADSVITNRMIAGNASIDFAKIGNVQITNAMVSSLHADKLTAGVLNIARIPNLTADKITIGPSTSFSSGYNPKSANDKIDGLEIGGRNLLRNSGRLVKNSNYNMADYPITDGTISNSDTVTITLKGELGSDRTDFRIYNSGGSSPSIILKDKGNGIFSFTGRWVMPNVSGVNSFLRVYQFTSSNTSQSTIEWIKLEKGNKATDWTPAPEDVEAEISSVDTKASTAQSTANTANTKATNAQSRVGTVEGRINNAVTTIDGSGVTVADGSFFLKDSQTNEKYSIVAKDNLIRDHSFELVHYNPSTISVAYQWFNIAQPPTNREVAWYWNGSPKVAVSLGGEINPRPVFGSQAVAVRSVDYVLSAPTDVSKSTTYTLSCHFKRQNGLTGGIPRLEVYRVDATGSRGALIASKTFTTVKSDYSVARHALTFTTPSTLGENDGVEVHVKSSNTNWVHADGVQLVEGSSPVIYDPETGFFGLTSGKYNYQANSLATDDINVRRNIMLNSNIGTISTSSNYLRIDAHKDYASLGSDASYVYLQTPQEVRVTTFKSGTNYQPIRASAFRVNGGVDMSANTIKNDNLNLYIGGNGKGVSSIGNGTSSVRIGTTNFNNQGTNSGIMYFGRDGTGERIWSYSIYERPYSSAANVYITGAGTLGRSTSASKYKLDISKVSTSELEHKLLSLDVKSWKDKSSVEGWAEYLTKKADDPELLEPDVGLLRSNYGLIAEDLVDAGLEMFVQYGELNKDGTREVEGIEYDRLWVLLIPIVRALKLDNENLKRQVDALYGRMEVLENKESV